MTPPDLAILVPVLRRPHRVAPLIESIDQATPEPYRLVFIADPDDAEERQAIDDAGAEMFIVAGNYASKINAGVAGTSSPLVFTGADDLHFHPGWLEAARERMAGSIGVVGTNDLCSSRVMAGEHSTHSLVARWYADLGTIDEPGKLLHEGYPHEYVDDELVQTAIYRGAFAHAADSIVEHLHPDAGKAPMDELYSARPGRMRRGWRLYERRRQLWTS